MTNMGIGYLVDYSSYMTIDILNNYIRSDYFGIDLRMNDNARHLLVENNYIHFGSLTPGSKGVAGINVIEQNGKNPDSKINSNHIWHVLGASNATRGISMTTASHYQVTNNEVNMVNNLNNQKGIITQSCSNDEISCNIITGPGTDYNLAKKDQSAIKIELGDYHNVSCNIVNGTTNGIYFSGYAYNTDVKGNEINYHKYGLRLDNFAIIGSQALKGNQWFASPSTGGWGALYENPINAGIYKFNYDNTASPGSTVEPPTWDPSNWFNFIAGQNFECVPVVGENYCDQFNFVACDGCDHEFNFEIAQDLIQNGVFTDPSQYELAKQLWKLLDENEVYRTTYTVLNDFYIANQNGLLDKVNEVMEAASNLYDIAPSVELALQNNKLQLDGLLSSLKANVVILLDENSTVAQKMAALSQIQAIQYNILPLTNFNISALELVQDSRTLNADNVNLVNSSLATSQIFEENEKQVNEIYLVTIAKGISYFTTQQIETLYGIAIQCPIAGGNAVWKARGLYSLIDDDMIYDDFITCLNAGVILREAATTTNTASEKNNTRYSTSISPNPTQDKATLKYNFPTNSNGTLVLVDSYGKEIYRTALESNSKEFTFSTLNINPSIYFYKVYSNDQLIGSGKLSIIR